MKNGILIFKKNGDSHEEIKLKQKYCQYYQNLIDNKNKKYYNDNIDKLLSRHILFTDLIV